MSFDIFSSSLLQETPPSGLNELQMGLWYAAKGDWEAAHNIAQRHEGVKDFDRLHAYLHRVEGDEWNADYWYRRARTTMPQGTIEKELEALIQQWS